MYLFHWPGRWTIHRNHQKCEEKVGSSNGCGKALQPNKRRSPPGFRNVKRRVVIPTRFQRHKACMHRGGAWVHDTTFEIISTERSRRSHRRQRIQLDDTWQFGAQVFSDASSDEGSGYESSSGQGMKEVRNDPSLAVGQSKQQNWGHSGSTKWQKESSLCYIDGNLSSQECGVRTKISEV